MNPKSLPPGFAEFWSAYPKRKAKGDSAKAFVQVGGIEVLPEILKDLKRRQWPTDSTFIPYPASYLRGWRWLDEETEEESNEDDW